jgi:arabinogalactan endo-1,4-beta-galactosidase
MPNLLGEDSLIPGYPATPAGQAAYLRDLSRLVLKSGGSGVIYWEPAWVSTHCRTPFGVGSGWENATFFDFRKRNETLPAIGFPRQALADAAAH